MLIGRVWLFSFIVFAMSVCGQSIRGRHNDASCCLYADSERNSENTEVAGSKMSVEPLTFNWQHFAWHVHCDGNYCTASWRSTDALYPAFER